MTGTRYSFPPDDMEGRDLIRLATKRATVGTLQMCPSLWGHRLVDELTPEHEESERVRTLRRLLDCVLFLAFRDWQADRSDLIAGDVLAAGALFGLISQSPSDEFPLSLPLRMNNWTNERRQRQALLWAGSNSAGSSRSARAWRDTYLMHFREFMHAVTVNGKLEECYSQQFAYADKRSPAEASELPDQDRTVGSGAPIYGLTTDTDVATDRYSPSPVARQPQRVVHPTKAQAIRTVASRGGELFARGRRMFHL